MTKYIFKKIKDPKNQFDTTDVTFEVDAILLDELLESFRDFLRASGFQVNELVEVKDDE